MQAYGQVVTPLVLVYGARAGTGEGRGNDPVHVADLQPVLRELGVVKVDDDLGHAGRLLHVDRAGAGDAGDDGLRLPGLAVGEVDIRTV